MRVNIGVKHGGDVHEAIKEYAEDHGLRHFQAYAALIRHGLEAEGYTVAEDDVTEDETIPFP